MGKKSRPSRSGTKKPRNSEKERRKKMAAKAAAVAAYEDHNKWLRSLYNQSVRTRSATQVMPPLLRRHGAGSASQQTLFRSRRRRR